MKRSDGKTRTGRARREKTMNMRMLRREHVHLKPELIQWVEALKPRSRNECREGIRPCPHVSCKYHLFLDVNPQTGSIKFNFPGLNPWDLKESCCLDIAEKGGTTLEEVGVHMNLTRERIRQLEASGMERFAETFKKEVQETE